MKNVMSAKAMEEIYVTYGLDEKTWDMFYNMSCHGLIDTKTWYKFYDNCHGYTYDENQTSIINHHGVTVYRMDEQGHMKRT